MREIGRVAGVTARPLGRVARERVVRAAIADAHLRRLAPSAAAPGFAARGGRAVRRAAALAGRAGALHARAAGLGRRALRRRARGAVLRLPPAPRGARAPRPRGRGVGGARRAARRPGALGPAAGLPLRLRRADPRAARRGRDARAARRGRGLRRAALRARAPRAGRQRRDGAGAGAAGAEVVELPERAEHYAGGRAAGAAPPRARAVRGRRRAARPPNGAVRLLEAGGERAEAELVGAEVLELMRDGVAPEEIAVLVRGRRRGAVRPGPRRLRDPGRRTSRRVPLGRTRLGAGVLAGARAALPGGTRRRPAGVAAHAGHGRRAPDGGGRARRARCAAHEVAGAREAAARWAPQALPRLDALADAAAEGGGGAPGRAGGRGRRAVGGAARAPRRRARPRRARRGAGGRGAAGGGGRAARARGVDPALLGGAEDVLETLGAVEVRQGDATEGVLLADPLEIRARRFRAVFVCGLQDARVPAAARCPSRSSTTTRGARSPRRRGCGCRCTRTCSTASARCSTPASRARRRCCSCPGARPTRRASRWSPRRSSTTCARCSPTSCGSSAGAGCWPR